MNRSQTFVTKWITRPNNSITKLFVQARLWRSIHATTILQWSVASSLGLILGVYALVAGVLPTRWAGLTFVAVLAPFGAIIIGNVKRLLLAIILLELPFQLDAYLGYQRSVAQYGAIGGLNISATTIALGVLYLLWFTERSAGIKENRALFSSLFPLGLPLVIYFTTVALSFFVAYNQKLAIFEIFLLFQSLFLYIYVVYAIQSREDLVFVITMLLIGLALEGLVMIWLKIVGHNISIAGITGRINEDSRVGGTIGSPNAAASFLCLLLAPTLSLLITPLGKWYKYLAMLALSLGGVGLVFTLSRGGWIAFLLSAGLLCSFALLRGWMPISVPVAAAFVALLLGGLFQDSILGRIYGDDNGSAHSRVPLMALAYRIIDDHVLFGVGSNNFTEIMFDYAVFDNTIVWVYTVHNKYLLVWSETGLIGLAAFLFFLLTTIYQGWRGWLLKDRLLSPIALAFGAAIMGQMIHMTVDIFKGRPQVQLLWLVAAIIIAIQKIGSESHEQRPQNS